jgi:glutamate racemase
MSSVRVGIFDSGYGGMSLVHSIEKELSGVTMDYVADLSNAPYGGLSSEQIYDCSRKICSELVERGADVIVVACNTATVHCIAKLREDFDIPFVGVEPYVNVLNKRQWSPEHKVVLLVTEATSKSKRLESLLLDFDPQGKIETFVPNGLASAIDGYWSEQDLALLESRVESELSQIRGKGYSHAILGCTHYPLVSGMIEKVLNVKTISPCPFVAKRVREVLVGKDLNEETSSQFNILLTNEGKWRTSSILENSIKMSI